MSVEMEVDGVAIPLNDFTQEIIGNIARGVTESLRGIDPGWTELVIRVRND